MIKRYPGERAPMAAPVVNFQRVSKNFGSVAVLRAIEFDLAPGQFLGLAGENGAGKTTLLKCMLDFCAVDGGAIEVYGVPWRRPEARARLAYLPERFTPPWFLTGREFLRGTVRLAGREWDENAVASLFGDLDLALSSLDKPVRTCSKGMMQKLGLVSCFLSRRDLLVLDEPMSGLDPRARARVKNFLLRLKAEGRALLFTSHSLADVEEICDHMVVLNAGAVAFCGSPSALCARYDEPSLERAFLKCIEPVEVGLHG
jgi:ABC-2 type transport system ATP-binding protein